MPAETKACNITEAELTALINSHGYDTNGSIEERLERMNYLHKRLKAFKEDTKPDAQFTADAKQIPETLTDAIGAASKGW